MIKLSDKSDKNGIINLWQEAFGDTAEAVELFLDNKYIPENTVICEENGKIASMLFLLEGKLKIKGVSHKAYYLYAAATLKEFRGRGIMAEMLDFSKKLAAEREVDFICLKPAEESLYGYYKKFGYKEIFASKKYKIKSLLSFKNEISNNFCETDREKLRNNAFENTDGFVWDKASIDYAVLQHKYYGGSVFGNCKGYLLYNVSDGKCNVKECCFTQEDLSEALTRLQSEAGIVDINIELPCNYQIDNTEFEIHKNGMAVAVTDIAESIINEINDLYLNLTLD